ncbi:MAG: spore germination protein GerW family protein [Acidimicrobiales bacterium]
MDARELVNRFGEHISVGRAFGSAYENDGSAVIPVAIVLGGGGSGAGNGPDGEKGEGGGFGGVVYPIGVYVVRDGDAKFVPSVNASRIAASVLSLVGISMNRALRRKRIAKRAKATLKSPATRIFSRGQSWRDSTRHHRDEAFHLPRLLRRAAFTEGHTEGE